MIPIPKGTVKVLSGKFRQISSAGFSGGLVFFLPAEYNQIMNICFFIVNTLEQNHRDSVQPGGSRTAARDRISGRVFDFIVEAHGRSRPAGLQPAGGTSENCGCSSVSTIPGKFSEDFPGKSSHAPSHSCPDAPGSPGTPWHGRSPPGPGRRRCPGP